MHKIYYIVHNSEQFRVWNENWPHDTFEVIDRIAFKDFMHIAAKFNLITFIEADETDD